MKRIFLVAMAAVLLAACSTDGYRIEGSFKDAKDGSIVYLLKPNDNLEVVDSAVIENGHFEFTGGYHDRTVRMLLVPSKATGGPVVLEPGVITVTLGSEMERGGTDGNKILQRFVSAKKHLEGLESVTSPTFVTAMGMGKSMLDSLVAEKEKAATALAAYSALAIENNIESGLAAYLLSQSYEILDVAKLAVLVERIPLYYRDSRYEIVKNYAVHKAAVAQTQSRMSVGSSYQNFELTAIDGEKVVLSDIVNKNDFTLLQFWASWCAPCRAELPQVDSICRKFFGEGLAFVSVSLDSDINDFKSAVEKFALSGVKLCNPAGGSSEVATAYGIDAIPANILINRAGMIVARNSSPSELAPLLERLLE